MSATHSSVTSVGNTADCVVSGVVHGCGVGDRDREYAVRQNVSIEWGERGVPEYVVRQNVNTKW